MRWRFYMEKTGREDVWDRTRLFAADLVEIEAAPVGSLFVTYANASTWTRAAGHDRCSVAKVVLNATGTASATVMRKDR